MMKKLILLTIAGAIAFGANAQFVEGSAQQFKAKKIGQPANNYEHKVMPTLTEMEAQQGSARKTTAGGSRWMSHIPTIKALNGGNDLTGTFLPIWFDSTMRQTFSGGSVGTINFSSAGQYLNPTGWKTHGYKLWADANVFSGDPIVFGGGDAYTVDSISFVGFYSKNPNRPTSIVDTLIISVAQASGQWRFGKQDPDNAWVTNYIPSNRDTLYAPFPYNTDSVNRAIFASAGTRAFWKVPLFDADRDTGNLVSKRWTLSVPTPVNVAPGAAAAFTVTFKSGDTWTKNVDTFFNRHCFFVGSSTLGDNVNMLYKYYEEGDRNTSQLMFSTDTSWYVPTVAIEGWNSTINYRNEYHQMEMHMVCPTCVTLSVNEANGNIEKTAAYPNPAVNNVFVPFKLKEAADVTVSITNALGQVVKTQNMGHTNVGQPEFNLSDLSTGVYIYVVEANGERSTGRISVTH
jgi:hypothetical protein